MKRVVTFLFYLLLVTPIGRACALTHGSQEVKYTLNGDALNGCVDIPVKGTKIGFECKPRGFANSLKDVVSIGDSVWLFIADIPELQRGKNPQLSMPFDSIGNMYPEMGLDVMYPCQYIDPYCNVYDEQDWWNYQIDDNGLCSLWLAYITSTRVEVGCAMVGITGAEFLDCMGWHLEKGLPETVDYLVIVAPDAIRNGQHDDDLPSMAMVLPINNQEITSICLWSYLTSDLTSHTPPYTNGYFCWGEYRKLLHHYKECMTQDPTIQYFDVTPRSLYLAFADKPLVFYTSPEKDEPFVIIPSRPMIEIRHADILEIGPSTDSSTMVRLSFIYNNTPYQMWYPIKNNP